MPENIQMRGLNALPDPLRTRSAGAEPARPGAPAGAPPAGPPEGPPHEPVRVELSRRPGAGFERAAAEAVARREEAVAGAQARLAALEDVRGALLELRGAAAGDRPADEAFDAAAEAGARTFAGVRLIEPGEALAGLLGRGRAAAGGVEAALAEVEDGLGRARAAVRTAGEALGVELVRNENAAAAAVEPAHVARAAEALRGRDAREGAVTVAFDPFQAAPLNRRHVLELLG